MSLPAMRRRSYEATSSASTYYTVRDTVRSQAITPRPFWPPITVWALFAFAATNMMGCSTSGIATSRAVIRYTAEGLVSVDVVVAKGYLAAAADALKYAATLEDYETSMAYWNVASDALVTARGALLAAESAVDAWEAGGDAGGAYRAISCLARAVLDLVGALRIVGVDPGPALSQVLELTEGILGGCTPER